MQACKYSTATSYWNRFVTSSRPRKSLSTSCFNKLSMIWLEVNKLGTSCSNNLLQVYKPPSCNNLLTTSLLQVDKITSYKVVRSTTSNHFKFCQLDVRFLHVYTRKNLTRSNLLGTTSICLVRNNL